MARTVNRTSFSVSTSLSNRDHFFNHSNWKGKFSSSNFLDVDQETFEDCENVYVDAQGLLTSRPAFKYSQGSVEKFWHISSKTIYLLQEGDGFRLKIEDGEITAHSDFLYPNNRVFPTVINDELFIFSDSALHIYKNGSIEDATSRVYVPTTSVHANGAREVAESENILSPTKKSVYLYDSSILSVLPTSSKVVAILDDSEYYIYNFTHDSVKRLTQLQNLHSENFADEYGESLVYTDFMNAAGNDRYFTLSKSSGNFELSLDGRSVSKRLKVSNVNQITQPPRFSADGSIIFFSTLEGPYVLSTLSNGPYQDFTLLKVSNQLSLPYDSCYFYDKDNYLLLFNSKVSSGANEFIAVVVRDGNAITFTNDGQSYYDFNPTYSVSSVRGCIMNILSDDSTLIHVVGNRESWTIRFLNNGAVGKNYLATHGVTECKILPNGDLISVTSSSANTIDYLKVRYPYTETDYEVSTHRINSALFKIFDNGFILTSNGIYDPEHRETHSFLNFSNVNIFPLGATDYAYFSWNQSKAIYGNFITSPIELQVYGPSKYSLVSFLSQLSDNDLKSAQLDDTYLSIKNKLYITSKRSDEYGSLLYLPEVSIQEFSDKITGLKSISSSEMGIFLPDEIWYSSKSEGIYHYVKSKLQLGLKDGADIVTSYDGTNTIFSTERGLALLSYQSFVASTDQSLTFLSDAISDDFSELSKKPVKLLRYKYWLICYNREDARFYVFDFRNSSWWPMRFIGLKDSIVVDDGPRFLQENSVFKLNTLENSHFDLPSNQEPQAIKWYITSQKLHLNAPNHYKHVSSITLMSVLNIQRVASFQLEITNYRNTVDSTDVETHGYQINTINTHVQRVSFPKVTEFQYTLRFDQERYVNLPAKFSGITIKYKVGSQVR